MVGAALFATMALSASPPASAGVERFGNSALSEIARPPSLAALVDDLATRPVAVADDFERFAPDCVILGGGRGFCVRSERDGSEASGRTYTIAIEVEDSCGNTTGRTANILVPHDSAPGQGCVRPNRGKRP